MKKPDNPHTATEAQINANRRNAKKSTGPKTGVPSGSGKGESSRNGLSHGLCANKHILSGEDPDDFLFLVQDLLDRFRPEGPGEEKLVLRIAADQWRLDRAFPMEAGIYRDRFQDVAAKDELRQQQYARKKGYAEGEGPNSFTKLARYESSIERSIDRCLRQLKAFQAARNTPGPSPQPGSDPGAKAPEPPVMGQAVPSCRSRLRAPKNRKLRSKPKKMGVSRHPQMRVVHNFAQHPRPQAPGQPAPLI